MDEIIGSIIKEYMERNMKLLERELVLKDIGGKAISVVGVRRSGKTSLLHYYFQKFRDEGKNVIFFPFDDDRVYPPSLETLRSVIKISKEIYPDGRLYLFFDEIQEIDGWEVGIKRLVERENHRVFLTGSSSKLMSKEIATQMRGRSLSYELFPFSFREILRLNGVEISKYYTENEEGRIKKLLKKYIEWGGFPEIWVKDEFADEILREYVDVMFYRDILERHNIRNYKAIKLFLKMLISSFSKRVSIRKISNYMKTQGVNVSRNTLYNYLEYCNDSYIIFPVRRYSPFLRDMEQSKPKIYPVDNGIIKVFAHRTSEDFGRLMESITFLELRRKYKENEDIFYYIIADGKEIDFLLKDEKEIKIIEVTYDLDYEHIKKVFKALDELKIKHGLILTWDTSDIVKRDGKRIKITPLWKWLLNTTL